MLRNYKLTEVEFEPIPFTNVGEYFCNLRCEVFDKNKEMIQPDENGEVEVKLIDEKVIKRSPLWFACLTFKTPQMELEDILKCEAKVIDENHISKDKWIFNVGWKFPAGGIPCRTMPGYNYVPGATKYAINSKGEVVNWFTNTAKKAKAATNIYQTMRVVDDSGHSAARMLHRLVGLAWLDYPMDNHMKQIDHLDGRYINNTVENLEWVTGSENTQRAMVKRTGWETRDIETGVITEFNTQKALAIFIGVTENEIGNMIRSGDAYAFRNRFQVRPKSEEPWFENPTLVWSRAELDDVGEELFECYDYHTNSIKILKGKSALEEYTEIIPSIINKILEEPTLQVIKGFCIRRVGDPKRFPTLSEEELKIAKVFDGKNRVIRVSIPGLGVTSYFANLNQVCDKHGLKYSVVVNGLKNHKELYTKGLIISYIN